MKQKLIHCCVGALICVLCVTVVACSDESGRQATGTTIGIYSNGFISILVQVDEEYPIGKTIEYANGTHQNMIQVQYTLPIKIGSRISFSFREYNKEKDVELFQWGAGNMLSAPPNIPMYVITEYEILNN